MVHKESSSISSKSVTECEPYYTPVHGYNTRLSARRLQRSQSLNVSTINFQDCASTIANEETYLIEDRDRSSERFSIASSNSFNNSPKRLFDTETESFCNRQIRNALIVYEQDMDFSGRRCPNNRTSWVIQSCIVFAVVLVAWYVNNVRTQLNRLYNEIESTNSRISDIVDANMDTLNQLSQLSNTVKDLKQSQVNFKHTIQNVIADEVDKMYNDKTGRTDFALESAGGRIVQLSPGTENYGQSKSLLLGISLCEGMHGPRAMIQTGMSPGECWALKGASGGVTIKLLGSVKINAVSLEHISKNISPSGESNTAPKEFTVWGLKSPTDRGSPLGQFTYEITGALVQTFELAHPPHDAFDFVELRILSNHGNPDFTCIYRFRVHGVLVSGKGKP